jgi:Uma2 family endonuclease
MNEILEIPDVRERVSPVSVEEYHLQPERNVRGNRTELIRGIVIEKMSKTKLHAFITSWLYRMLLSKALDGYSVWQDQPLTFIDSEPEPDISIIKGEYDDRLRGHPGTAELVIEVAVSSLRLDRELASLYAENGVREYWIIDTSKRQVEVYKEPQDGRYAVKETYDAEEIIKCDSIPAIELQVGTLFPNKE